MTTEQRVAKAHSLIAAGAKTSDACETAGVSSATYYKRRRELTARDGADTFETNFAQVEDATQPNWRVFAAEGVMAANIPTGIKVQAIRELYSI